MAKAVQQETVQIKVSPSLKKRIRQGALECDETLKTFVLKALRSRGIAVSDEELMDRRRVVAR